MKVMLIVFIVVSILFALATLTYVISDMIKQKRGKDSE